MTAKKRRGYPAWLTEEAEAAVIESVEAGNTVTTAVAGVGIDPAEVYRWASESADDKVFLAFTLALSTARAKAEQAMTEALTADAKGGFLVRRYTKVLPNGVEEVDESYAPPNGRVALSWLQARNGRQWGKPEQPSDMLGADVAAVGAGGPGQEQGTIEALAGRLHMLLTEQDEAEGEPDPEHPVVPGHVLPPGTDG